jgi:hypothetical protein
MVVLLFWRFLPDNFRLGSRLRDVIVTAGDKWNGYEDAVEKIGRTDRYSEEEMNHTIPFTFQARQRLRLRRQYLP